MKKLIVIIVLFAATFVGCEPLDEPVKPSEKDTVEIHRVDDKYYAH